MRLTLGIVVVVLLVAGLAWVRSLGQAPTPAGGLPVTGISWRPVAIGDEMILADSGMHVLFEMDGNLSGHAGCNRFFGSLQQSESGVEVGPVGSTRMACPEPIMRREDAFLGAIQKTKRFRQREGRLELLDADGKVLAELVADG